MRWLRLLILLILIIKNSIPLPPVASESVKEEKSMKAVWLTQFDMTRIYVQNGKQRSFESFSEKADIMIRNLLLEGFNTVFLQIRPNGDSMYESEIYPVSKYISGAYGSEISYDALGVFVNKAKAKGIEVHAWINPYRLMTVSEMQSVDKRFKIRSWYDSGADEIVTINGRLYLNPACGECVKLIADGAAEILDRYSFDGLHIDDYFYPASDDVFDEKQFSASGYESLGDFRRDCVSRAVKALCSAANRRGKVFGVSPAGNIDSLRDGYYADVERWCGEDGYIDYILPQLYYGFKNKTCPFSRTLTRWTELAGNKTLYIGISASKAVAAYSGEIDVYAGTDEGRREWIENPDVLAREIEEISADKKCGGYCVFSYSSLFDPVTGERNEAFSKAYECIAG